VLEPKLGLPIEPRLRDEHRQQAEHDREGDHHDGTGTHGRYSRKRHRIGCCSTSLRSVEFFLKQFWAVVLC